MKSGEYTDEPMNNVGQFSFRRGRSARPIRNSKCVRQVVRVTERTGHWSEKQNAKYYAFLQKFKPKFNQKESRREWKVFKALAQFIKTRNANQCRSHHHKMQKNYASIEETLHFLLKKKPSLQVRSQKYLDQLNSLEKQLFDDRNDKLNEQNQNQKERLQDMLPPIKSQRSHPDQDQEPAKKDNIANMKTATGYDYDDLPVGYGQEEQKYQVPVYPQTSFMPVNLMQPSFENPSLQHYYPCPTLYPQAYKMYPSQPIYQMPPNPLCPRQQKLMEAHECFVKWITKLRTLIIRDEEELATYSTLPENNMIYTSYL